MTDQPQDPNTPPPGYGQPYGAPGGAAAGPPPNYLVWAILATVLCCLPFGVVSIVFAAQVNSKYAAGDYAGALASSNKARTWAIASAVTGAVLAALYFLFIVVLAAGS